MTDPEAYRPLDQLARRLPFELDDIGRVNELFIAYAKDGGRSTEVQLEVWTYCFVRRYFTYKLARDSAAGGADLDALLDTVYGRIRNGREGVKERYASWVSVICRNAWLNYLRDRRAAPPIVSHDLEISAEAYEAEAPTLDIETDLARAMMIVEAAIRRLPLYLQGVTRLRLLDDLSYDEIAVIVDRPVAIVRSYAHKAIRRLRSDRTIQAALGRGDPPEVMSEQ